MEKRASLPLRREAFFPAFFSPETVDSPAKKGYNIEMMQIDIPRLSHTISEERSPVI